MHNDKLGAHTILQELHALEKLLHSSDSSTGLTALVRLVQSNSTWTEVLRDHDLDQWLALSLNENKFPALTQIQKHLSSLSFQNHDQTLMGLSSKHAFDQALNLEIERATRAQGPLSLALIALDNLNIFNQQNGQLCTDLVLQNLASILTDNTRKIDLVACLEEQKFALLLPGIGLMGAQRLLQRIQNHVRQGQVQCIPHGPALSFTCSIGLASYRGKAVPNAKKLMSAADKALQEAQALGKNRIECAPLLDLGVKPDQTLVAHEEKQFLFASFGTPDR